MRRETLIAYLKGGADAVAFQGVLDRFGMAGEVHDGGIEDAIGEVGQWRVVPGFLVLDISGVEDVRGALDRLAQTAPEGETSLILVGTENDIEVYRRLRSMGIADYMTRPVRMETLSDILDALLRERRERGVEIDPTRACAIVGARGGVGTSLIAASVAHIMSQSHKKRTLLVDLDLAAGAQHVMFDEEASVGFLDMLENPSRIDTLFLERSMVPVSRSLSLLSSTSAELPPVEAESVITLVQQAQAGMEMVLLDVPCRAPVPNDILLAMGTVYIVVVPTLIGLRDGVQLAMSLESKNFQGKLAFIVNRTGESRSGSVPASEFTKRTSVPTFELPFDPRSATAGMMESKPVAELRGPLPTALGRLASSLPTCEGGKDAGSGKGGFFSRVILGRE